MAEFLKRCESKAQKSYTCDLCGKVIVKGARYIRGAHIECCDIRYFRHHIHCDALLEKYIKETGADTYCADDMKRWAWSGACMDCSSAPRCKRNVLMCPISVTKLLPPVLLTHEEVRRYFARGDEQ